MSWLRHSLRFLVVATAVLLVSCLDGHEEVWLNGDGSCRAEVRYSLPAAAARLQGGEAGVKRLIDGLLEKTKALQSSSCEVTTDKDRLQICVRVAFGSVLDLKRLAAQESLGKLPSSASKLAGKVKVGLSGRTVDFSRTISAGGALPGVGLIPAAQFKGRKLTYIIHLPAAAEESNATRTADGGRTLVWDFPLAEAIRKPVTTQFKLKIPIPTWLVISAAATVVSLGWLGYWLIQRRRRQKRAAANSTGLV